MEICSFCTATILKSKEYWDYHHSSYSSLRESARCEEEAEYKKSVKRIACLFCSTLLQDIESLAPDLQEEKWPLYRWTIRSLAKIQESKETIVITFHPVPHATTPAHKDPNLPTRTFFMFLEDSLSPLPTPAQLGNSTDPSKNSGHQIRAWIQTCDKTHPGCTKRRTARAAATPNAAPFIPTRLLDISAPERHPIRVIETAKTTITSPYCTLSHCWGRKPFVRLLQSKYEKFTSEGIDPGLLPLNFTHAVQVARFLGVRYIWIDSLCIIQEDAVDWGKEAGRMHQVYRNSYVNIAVGDSGDSEGGLFRGRDAGDVGLGRYKDDEGEGDGLFGGKAWRVVREDLWEREVLGSKLYGRGWVFQERMLAPRILHFTEKQIFWDCPSLSACESLPNGLPPPMDRTAGPDRHWRGRMQEPEGSNELVVGENDDSLPDFWKTAVWKYTSCNLTKGSDKLTAMWGIAKLVRDALRVEYGDGLWEKNLEDQLVWRVAECKLEMRPSEANTWELKRDIPSWSWASMDGKIVVPDRMSDREHFTVKDHYGRPLSLDLVGVKRVASPVTSKPVLPAMQTRGMSDTVAELKSRRMELEKQYGDDLGKDKHHQRRKSPEPIDRDQEPKFHSKSISIQGHVGRGHLHCDTEENKWRLKVSGLPDVSIEAFPDIIPKLNEPDYAQPYFVVLSAKQITKGPDNSHDTNQNRQELCDYVGSDEKGPRDFEVEGHGILMKEGVRDSHFRRTGAFKFRGFDGGAFGKLLKTYEWEGLAEGMYSDDRGRKFWLD